MIRMNIHSICEWKEMEWNGRMRVKWIKSRMQSATTVASRQSAVCLHVNKVVGSRRTAVSGHLKYCHRIVAWCVSCQTALNF